MAKVFEKVADDKVRSSEDIIEVKEFQLGDLRLEQKLIADQLANCVANIARLNLRKQELLALVIEMQKVGVDTSAVVVVNP